MPQTDHAQEWEDAKEHFEAVTGEDKPNSSFFKHRTGLTKKLKTLDELFDVPSDRTDLKKYEKEIKAFTKAADEYIEVLDAEIQKERNKQAEKTRKRALQALKTRLQSYEALYNLNLEDKKSSQEGANALETLQRRLGKQLKLGVANCVASLKAIKSDPAPAIYNAEMEKGARSLTTALKGFRQIRDLKKREVEKAGGTYQQSDMSRYWFDKAEEYGGGLTPYADGRGPAGDKRTVDETADQNAIMAEIKTVSDIVKAVVATFDPLLK